MKSLFLSMFLFGSAVACFAQLPKDESGNVVFTEVVEVEGLNKDQLFNNGKTFFDEYYRSSTVLKEEDKAGGKLNGEYFLELEGIDGKVKYEIKILVKSGRYKYILTNFNHQDYGKGCSGAGLENDEPKCAGGGRMSKSTWKNIKEKTKSETEVLISSLKETMAQKGAVDSGDDW